MTAGEILNATIEFKAPSGCISDSNEHQLADMLDHLPPLDTNENGSYLVEILDECEEPKLPPPLPFFSRRSSAPPSLLHMNDFTSSGSTHYLDTAQGFPRIPGRGLLGARNMTKSMPNLHNSRSSLNRCIGSSLSENSDCRGGKGKQLRHSRAQEFEQLLDGI